VTLALRTRAGSGASNNGSMRTLPVKYSAGPLLELCEPGLLISIVETSFPIFLLLTSQLSFDPLLLTSIF